MARTIGQRVGAISHTDDKNVYVFGFGTYQGYEVPPEDIKFFGLPIRHTNPKILLDSGKVVWGCECWWGDEESVKRTIDTHVADGKTLVEVDIEKARKEASEA